MESPVELPKKYTRSRVHNPVSYFGFLVVILSFITIVFLLITDITSGHSSPYIGIFLYMVLPGFFVLGLVFVPIGMGLENRRRRTVTALEGGFAPPPFPEIDLNLPKHQRIFAFWVVGTVVVLVMLSTITYRGYAFTDSTRFCGLTCHQVMRPEYTAYKDSPHSRVNCTECHIGPGASWFVQAKISGIGQVLAVLGGDYHRPIATPLENLRPARDTCEECHWPSKFFGDQLVTRPHFAADVGNTDRSVSMVMRTGGNDAGRSHGIHWHVEERHDVRYVATDEKRQSIPWVSAAGPDGQVTEYFSTENPVDPGLVAKAEKRIMDCLDCHNRPTHIYYTPDQALDRAMAAGKIDKGLPFVKKTVMEAVTKDYKSEEEAKQGIKDYVERFYAENYPELVKERPDDIGRSIGAAQEAWVRNVFPEMDIKWGTYTSNLGHKDSPGCFRCHDGKHVSKDGQTIRQDCTICHSPPVPALAPAKVATSGAANGQPQGQTGSDAAPKGLHSAAAHKLFTCDNCHNPASWKIESRDTCLNCHKDRGTHNAGNLCQACHNFEA